MNELTVTLEYEKYKDIYKKFQKEIFDFLNEIRSSKEYDVDIAEIKERPNNQIKKLDSILDNIKRPDKYISYSSIFDIKDISGIRIICHCEDDLLAFAEIIENKLNENKFIDIKKEIKGAISINSSESKKNRPSYRAIHITFCKYFFDNKKNNKIYCEIQMRTVMGDAWAVQDRKYRYGESVSEGDRNILTDSVSEVMSGCEGLWSLVKKKYKEELSANKKNKPIKTAIKGQVKILKQRDANKFASELKKDKIYD